MKIINIKKIKIILFLTIFILFLITVLSLFHPSCKKTNEKIIMPVLEAPPETLLYPENTYKPISKSSNKYSITKDGSVIIKDSSGRRYTISDDGTLYEIIDDIKKTTLPSNDKTQEILSSFIKASEEDAMVKNLINTNAIEQKINETSSSINNNAKTNNNSSFPYTTPSQRKSNSKRTNSDESFLIKVNTPTKKTYLPSQNETNSPSMFQNSTENLASSLIKLNTEQTEYKIQNAQDEKAKFLENMPKELTKKSPKNNTIAPGTIIPITLITGINTDLPGSLLSQVSTNIYDTATETTILIPKGAKLIGTYDSSLSYAQDRLIVVWNTLVLPDGTIYDVPGLIGIDNDGKSGWSGNVNKHIWNILGSVGLASVINLGTTALSTKTDNAVLNALLTSSSKASSSVANTYISKEMNRQPTITIDKGKEFNVIVTSTLEF